ncbi:MAG: dihydroxy-acid dehydratase [Deltaproteobacteria bacterium]|nr:dihydroxy-acid dehydratase [Deltaproteobacteria bacterium]
MRSDAMKKGLERAPHRSLFKAMGYTDSELERPLIGVANSANEVIPGHIHLHEIGKAVKKGIRMAGGTPMEFNTIGICDGIAMGHGGMKYSLGSRELIADSVEVMARAYPFDGLVLVADCDKIVPGMMMAMARLNIPAIVVSGGPMLAGWYHGKEVDLITVFEAVGRVATGEMSLEELSEIESVACPGPGSCAGMFTANSMNCCSEALGIALPGNGTIPAIDNARLRLAQEAGQKVMELVDKGIRPRDLLTQEAFANAIAVDMAFGGSTNTALHLPAIAHEVGLKIDLDIFNQISQKTPHLCNLSPGGPHHVQDLHRAGGIPALMKELSRGGLLNTELLTVTGKTVGENIVSSSINNSEVIRPLDNPYHATGGLVFLFGNLAPDGGVVKASAVAPEMLRHQGPARVFESEEDALRAILAKEIVKGEVIVIRYEGPKGGPGMREMLAPTSAIAGIGMDKEVSLITDGRFSGGTRGAAIGHISPEAAEGGTIAVVRDGDIIEIDIPAKRLQLHLTEEEIKQRLKDWRSPEPKIKSGYMYRYAQMVSSASTGAVFRER